MESLDSLENSATDDNFKTHSFLKNLDHLLCCPICHEYMQTAVISITCSHNFCSLCIRKYVTLRNKCPVCSAEVSTGVLRPNRILGEIIDCFKPLQALITGEKINHSEQRETVENDETTSLPQVNQERLINSPVKTRSARKSTTPQNLVQCPVCQKEFDGKLINTHIDSCLKTSSSSGASLSSGTSAKTDPCRKPLPKLVYSIMKDSEIRSRLKTLNLSTKGDRATLINRHKAFTVLYNAECDSVQPRPVTSLIAFAEKTEAVERQLAAQTPTILPRKVVDIETVEKQNRQYLLDNKESFNRLIDEIKKRTPVPSPSPVKTPPPTGSTSTPPAAATSLSKGAAILTTETAPPPEPTPPLTEAMAHPPAEAIASLPTEAIVSPPTEAIAFPAIEAIVSPPTEAIPSPPIEAIASPPTEAIAIEGTSSTPQIEATAPISSTEAVFTSPTEATGPIPPIEETPALPDKTATDTDDDDVEILENVPKPVKNIIEVTLDDDEESTTPETSPLFSSSPSLSSSQSTGSSDSLTSSSTRLSSSSSQSTKSPDSPTNSSTSSSSSKRKRSKESTAVHRRPSRPLSSTSPSASSSSSSGRFKRFKETEELADTDRRRTLRRRIN